MSYNLFKILMVGRTKILIQLEMDSTRKDYGSEYKIVVKAIINGPLSVSSIK